MNGSYVQTSNQSHFSESTTTMVLIKKPFLAAAAAAATTAGVVSAQSHPKTNDPSRIVSAAESIDRQLRQGNLRKTPGAKSSPYSQVEEADTKEPSPRTQIEADTESSSSSSSSSPPRELSEQTNFDEVLPDLKIIGGTPSQPNRYPYLASLNYYGSHICGGSLVAQDMILTAAHCEGYASTVELGRWDRDVEYNPDMHDRIEVAYEIKHPDWNVKTVDNDFMLMKLVTNSRSRVTITLNTDPNYPSIPGEELTLMGWGDTNADPDVNSPGMQLSEVTLEYIPNQVCIGKEGTLDSGDYVKYDGRLTDNMMCAMDEDGGRGDDPVDEDTCVGDSGGPMIKVGSGGMPDVQVGIVSWGIGCASPMFPGVYSRISSQYEWIRKSVCKHSGSPPDAFNCDGLSPDESDSAAPAFPLPQDDEDEASSVTLEVSLDEQPEEFSWLVSTIKGANSQMVAAIPPGFYSGYTNYTFHHKLKVEPDSFYRISLFDKFGDGLKGYVAVYRGSVPILSNLITYERLFYDKDRTDLKRIDHAFYTGKEPKNVFSLAINFDKFPKDTWWKLESETDGVILAQRPAGWYNARFELMRVVETIPVFGARPDNVQYRFTIGDSYPCEDDPTQVCGDGICCNYGNGGFKLYAGTVGDGQLMTEGGEYGLSESVLVSPPASAIQ